MNVNLLRNNPNWLWYLLAGILVQVMVTSVWMFLKYSAVRVPPLFFPLPPLACLGC